MTTTSRGQGMLYEVTADTRAGGAPATVRAYTSRITFDGSAETGQVLPGPADLLCAAMSACILKNVERFSHILPFRYQSATVRVTAERHEPPPKIRRMHYDLQVVTDEPPERVELLHRNIRRYGTITNTLAAACDLDGTITATRSDTAI